jgi:phospholipid/cholesterol/gamma-HCH transport system substrate-binding protein
MKESTKNLLIGLFVTTGLCLGVAMMLFFSPSIGDRKQTLRVRFTNIAGIVKGTRVTFAGKPVGEVVAIQELSRSHEEGSSSNGFFPFELTLKIDSSVEVYSHDDISIRTTGLMGERSVNIAPKVVLDATTHLIDQEEPLYATSHDPLDAIFTQVSKLATQMEGTVHQLTFWLQAYAPLVENTLHLTNHSLTSLDAILTKTDQSPAFSHLEESSRSLSRILDTIDANVHQHHLIQNLSSLTDSLHSTAIQCESHGVTALKHLEQLLSQINSGEGTIGKLLQSDHLYLRLHSLISKGETILHDINHYGLLFQYDKKWQRARTKKANLLKDLESPLEFQAFFQTEIDGITTSLGRLTELLHRGSNLSLSKEPSARRDYHKQFAQLMRKVEELACSVKLYNEELSQSLAEEVEDDAQQ